MKKLIRGIVEFRQNVQGGYRERFGRLASGQKPDALFIGCSDSRVVPNTFASTDPGDLFVIRNVGNLVCPCDQHGVSMGDESEAAAIEFAILNLNVSDIIICGHSSCGAMQALVDDRNNVQSHNLKNWLRHAEPALSRLNAGFVLYPGIAKHDQLSQINVLTQMDHVKTYPVVKERIQQGRLRIHGWWFDIQKADVYSFEKESGRFILINEENAPAILNQVHN